MIQLKINSPASVIEGKSYTVALTITNQSTKADTPVEAMLGIGISVGTEWVTIISPQISSEYFSSNETRRFEYTMNVPLGSGGQQGLITAWIEDPVGKTLTSATEDLIIEKTIVWGTGIPTIEERDYAIAYGREKLKEYSWVPGMALTTEQWDEVYRYITPLAQRYTDEYMREWEEYKNSPEYLEVEQQLEELQADAAPISAWRAPSGVPIDYMGNKIDPYTGLPTGETVYDQWVTEVPEAIEWSCIWQPAYANGILCHNLINAIQGLLDQWSAMHAAAQAAIQWKITERDNMYEEVLK